MGERSRLVAVTCLQHNRTLVSGLWNHFVAENGVNCELNVGGRRFRAHRLVAELFLSPDKLSTINQLPLEPGHKSKTNERRDDDSGHLNSLLEFLYTGRTTVQEGRLGKLLEVAREVDFRLLVDAVKEADAKISPFSENFCSDYAPEKEPLECFIDVAGIEDVETEIGSEIFVNQTVSESFEASSAGIFTDDRRSDDHSDSSKENGSKVAGLADGPPDAGNGNSTRRISQRPRKLPAKFLSTEVDIRADREVRPSAKKRAKLLLPKLEPVDPEKVDHVEPLGPSLAVDSNSCPVQPAVAPRALPYKYSCSRCDFRTNRGPVFRNHMANHDPNAQKYHCARCSNTFLTQVSLQGHRCVKTTTKKMYTCSQCEFRNRYKAVYRVHLKSEHGIDVGPVFKCEECGRPFLSAQTMERHAADKHGWTPVDTFRCPHCRYETPKVWSYNHHLLSEHQINAKGDVLPRVKCDQCELTCKTQQDLQAHVLLWHQMQEGVTGSDDTVETSPPQPPPSQPPPTIMVEIADRSKMCELCGYSAAVTPDELKEHKLSHVGSKEHRCEICSRILSDRTTLRRHVLTHIAGDKRHGCHVCSYASNRRDNLRSHLRNVHKMNAGPTRSLNTCPQPNV